MIKLNIKFDEQHHVDGFKRYRRQHAIRDTWFVAKIIILFIFIILSIITVYHGENKPAIFFAVVIIIMLFGHNIDYVTIRYRSRKSPFFNEDAEITFSENGFHIITSKSEDKSQWSVFTKAVAFRDGFLLFLGPSAYFWLPLSKISEGTVEGLMDLITKNIIKFKAIEQPL